MAKNNEYGSNVVTEKGVLDSYNSGDNASVTYNSVTNNRFSEDTLNSNDSDSDQMEDNRKASETTLKKIVAIVIPLIAEKSEIDIFDGMDFGETHFIIADNIYLAKNKLYRYLKLHNEPKVENIIIDTHGGGAGLIYVDNRNGTSYLDDNFIGYNHLQNYSNYPDFVKQNVLGLKMILEKIKDNGHGIFLGCTIAKGTEGRKFSIKIHQFNFRANTFTSEAYNNGTIGIEEGTNTRSPYYNRGGKKMPAIIWGLKVPILSNNGNSIIEHTNIKGEGFKVITAQQGLYKNLEKTSSFNGNLYIDGQYATFQY